MRVELLSVILLLTFLAKREGGQGIDSIATDGYDQTEFSSLVPKGLFKLEVDFLYENQYQPNKTMYITHICGSMA